MHYRFFFALLFVFSALACSPHLQKAQAPQGPQGNAGLQSGPMLGYVDMFEALIWVQTKSESAVQVEYWDSEKTDLKYKTNTVQTTEEHGFTAKCIANKTQPGRSYLYTVLINGEAVQLPYPATFKTQTLWQYRTDPPAFSVATGSCTYVNEPEYDRPGKPYGSEYGIFANITAQKPDLMVWLGDNYYYREPDFYTRTGMLHRATHTRSLPEMQPLLAATHHYGIWDDHDYGPNDADGTFVQKEMAWEVFRDFWGNPFSNMRMWIFSSWTIVTTVPPIIAKPAPIAVPWAPNSANGSWLRLPKAPRLLNWWLSAVSFYLPTTTTKPIPICTKRNGIPYWQGSKGKVSKVLFF